MEKTRQLEYILCHSGQGDHSWFKMERNLVLAFSIRISGNLVAVVASKSTRAFQFSLKASEKTDDPCIVLKKMSRIWLAMFAKLWQKPVYAPCKPAQDLSNVFVRTYLWFWPAFIWRFFFGEEKFSWLPPKKQSS